MLTLTGKLSAMDAEMPSPAGTGILLRSWQQTSRTWRRAIKVKILSTENMRCCPAVFLMTMFLQLSRGWYVMLLLSTLKTLTHGAFFMVGRGRGHSSGASALCQECERRF